MVRKIGELEISGVKLQCWTEEGKQLSVQVIGRFEKTRVRKIGIPLYITFLNSLIIHQVKTKKITTAKEVWIPVLISIDFDDFISQFLLSFCFD